MSSKSSKIMVQSKLHIGRQKLKFKQPNNPDQTNSEKTNHTASIKATISSTNDGTLRFGTHLNTGKHGFDNSIKFLKSLGGNSMQVFVGNNKSYIANLKSSTEAGKIKKLLQDQDIYMIVHSPYLLNFARSPSHPIFQKSVNRLAIDLINANQMGAHGVVLHMGKNVEKLSYQQACQNMVEGMTQSLRQAKQHSIWNALANTKILVENMAGQGTSMDQSLKLFAEFWSMIPADLKSSSVGICMDTCHLFSLGEYDISKPSDVSRFYQDFDRLIGWSEIDCFHFNDSMLPFGCKKDRHQDIGNGCIGETGLSYLAILAQQHNQPVIMECPAATMSIQDMMNRLKEWCEHALSSESDD